AFSFPLSIQNNPIIIEVTGLPLGVSFDPASLTISGTPRESGTFAVLITAANQTGTVYQNFTLTIAPQDRILTNVSTRLKVQTGDNLMIGGFIIEGPVPKKVLVRGVGPALAQYNIPNVLADPTLEIRDVNGALVASNDDWQQQAAGAVNEIAFSGLAPSD